MKSNWRGHVLARAPRADVPVHVFQLADAGVDAPQFLSDVRPTFDRLAWDRYDQLNAQLAYLADLGGAVAAEANRIHDHTGADRIALLDALTSRLPAAHKAAIDGMQPFRRRAMRKYRLEHIGGGEWSAVTSDDGTFVQPVSDYRKAARVFDLIADEVANHPGVLTMLASSAETVRASHPSLRALNAVLHQVAVVARPGVQGFPAPEGVHQDGADYIVSAMVVERVGVSGGLSKIYDGRTGPTVVEVELQAGQGIFQADDGTDLWHEITPIKLDREGAGHRMTLGIDLHLDR